METLLAMKSRKSHRAYLETPVTDAQLEQIVLAGCAAPVGIFKAGRPAITVVQNKEWLEKLKAAAGRDLMYGATVLIIVSSPELAMAPEVETSNGGCVTENMLLAATDLGLGSIYLWGPVMIMKQHPELLEDLHLPEGYHPVAAMGLGVPAEAVAPCKAWDLANPVNYIK